MSISVHIKQQVVREYFCQKGLILLESGKAGFFCFIMVGKAANISKICHTF